MKKYLNTIYVTTDKAMVRREREALVIQTNETTLGRFPIHMLQGLVTFGPIWVSPFAMALCAENNVTISHFTSNGKFLARVHGPVNGNILLRKEQYRVSDSSEKSAAIAKAVIASKIANSRQILQRHIRNHPDKGDKQTIEPIILRLGKMQEKTGRETDLEKLRGIEGAAADDYFSCFNALITSQKDDFLFTTRNRRPPLDRVNALLSFVYTLLVHDCRSALEGVGLDPQAGFLHRDRPGRPSLALDLMEQFRAFLADRLVLSLINMGQVQAGGFETTASGAVNMDEVTRKTVLAAWQKRKQEELRHPFLDEKIPVGLLFHVQALLLARTLRGDLEYYPAFAAR